VLAVARLDLRDLARRRMAMGLLLALPLAFYASAASGEGAFVLQIGGIGVAWAVTGAGLFLGLGARGLAVRLVLAGYRPAELLAGQVLVLTGLSLGLAAPFSAVVLAAEHPAEPATFVVAVVLVALGSVPAGLLLGAVAPTEMEGTLGLIGILGVQLSVPADAGFGVVLPLHGPVVLIERAYGTAMATSMPVAVLHAGVATAVLLALTAILHARRLHVAPSA
jgi:hypothetical protein